MKDTALYKWFRNIPIAKKLYFTTGIMALLIAVELFSLWFSVNTLSSVRAYVGAEGLYAKAQKNAVYSLRRYERYHDVRDYIAYQNFLKVNLGDNKTRVELEKASPDYNIARQGFIEGRSHSHDVDGMINVFIRFRKIYYIDKAIAIWAEADPYIVKLVNIGERLHKEIISIDPSQNKIESLLKELDATNDKLTTLEDNFSYTLGEGSRWLENVILKLLLGIALTVEISGLLLTIYVSRGISTGINDIVRVSKKIAKGDFKSRAKVYSSDEIGVLAESFNQMTDQLEQNIKEREASEKELTKAKEHAEKSAIVKKQFLANMSHEIRTPMNGILGFTKLLEDTRLTREQREYLEVIHASGENLLNIINDILDFSKIEAHKISFEETHFTLRSVVDSVINLMQNKAHEKGLSLFKIIDSHIPSVIVGDPLRLNQILLNFVSNGIKFTETGEVVISANIYNEGDDWIEIKFNIADTGIGIPQDKISTIFESFKQASNSTTRLYGGTGLGLTIAKQLIELQDGSINVDSEVGIGTNFSFNLKFKRQYSNSMPDKNDNIIKASLLNLNNTSVLLVEDNLMNQLLAKTILKRWGVKIDLAENGKEAIDKIHARHYDVVLMDIQMPEIDGYAATTELRKYYSKRQLPIIAMTAEAMLGEKENCIKAGMNDYISKPFNPYELNFKIYQVLHDNAA